MLLQNKEVLEKCTELSDKYKNQIETISCDKPSKYEKHFMKIRSESDDDLPLGKILSIPMCIIAVRSVFKRDKYYSKVYLHECLIEFVNKL